VVARTLDAVNCSRFDVAEQAMHTVRAVDACLQRTKTGASRECAFIGLNAD
jgi:hypothetical protein